MLIQISVLVSIINIFFIHAATAANALLKKTATVDNYDEEMERIIKGKDARPGMYPWVVALYYENNYICTASIISPTTIMTAAHCVNYDSKNPGRFHAIAGNVDRSASEYRVDFSEIIPHPGYQEDFLVNDIAILKTNTSLPVDDEKIKPICIAKQGTHHMKYLIAIASGWGDTDKSMEKEVYPNILQYTIQKIIKNSWCKRTYDPPEVVDDDKLCATGIASGICTGDSGGPLAYVSLIKSKPAVQIGIASFINADQGCGKTLAPAVFVRLSHYNKFIREASKDAICFI